MKFTTKQLDTITQIADDVCDELSKSNNAIFDGLTLAYPNHAGYIIQVAITKYYMSVWMNTLPEDTTISEALAKFKESVTALLEHLTPDDFYFSDDEDKTSNRK